MTQRVINKITENFRHVLSRTEGQLIKRKDLINLAQKEFLLSRYEAEGLIDRNIHILKKNGALYPEGSHKNRGYVFQLEILDDVRSSFKHDTINILTKEKRAAEIDLHMTKYELKAYEELLPKVPHENMKIIKLYEKATEKVSQLQGKLRAINQLIS